MSDHDERTRTPDAGREASSTVPENDTERLQPPPEPLDVMSEEEFEEHGLGADPPMDVDPPPASDDEALAPGGDGVTETPFRPEFESVALRSDLALRLEGIVISAREWAQEDGTDEAHAIAEALADIYDRVGAPIDRDAGDHGSD